MHPNNLKHYRQKKGMTQARLAGIAGISVQALQFLEYGHFKPRHATAQNLAKALDTTAEKLFPVEGSGRGKQNA